MTLIERPDYINRLWNLRNTPDIKMITGMRRSGKSCLLKMLLDKIKAEDPTSNIITIDFNSPQAESISEYHKWLANN